MKVLLRNATTSRFYVGNNQWTADPGDARDFDQVEVAMQFQREEQLTDMEVVVHFDDLLGDLVLPIRKRS